MFKIYLASAKLDMWFDEAGLVLVVVGGGAGNSIFSQICSGHALSSLYPFGILFIGEIKPILSFLMQPCSISNAVPSIYHRLFHMYTMKIITNYIIVKIKRNSAYFASV